MSPDTEAPGCRNTALVTTFLLAFGIIFFAIGLTLINRSTCAATCETLGLTLLYAGGPISALIGFFTDSVIVAWPLDVTLWVVLGFATARLAQRRDSSVLGLGVTLLALAVVYGLVLSLFVDLAV